MLPAIVNGLYYIFALTLLYLGRLGRHEIVLDAREVLRRLYLKLLINIY